MKKAIYCFVLIIPISICVPLSGLFAQKKESSLKALYLELPFRIGFPGTKYSGSGIQTVWSKGWMFGISKEKFRNEPDNLPADYTPASSNFLGSISFDKPQVTTHYNSFTAGFRKNISRNTWVAFEAGPSFVRKEVLKFSPSENTAGTQNWLGDFFDLFGISATPSNYTYSSSIRNQAGAVINGNIQWAFTSLTALHLGLQSHFTSGESRVNAYLGVSIGLQGSQPRKAKVRE